MYVIKYQGADHKREDGMVYGCFSYYADPTDAFKHHNYVNKLVSWVDHTHQDYLGKTFRFASDSEVRAFNDRTDINHWG